MVDTVHDTRTMLVNGGYLSDMAGRNLRHIDDRLFMQRLKEDQQHNDRFVYKPIITCNVKDSNTQFITLQGTSSQDTVEFVTLEDFLISDPNSVFENIIHQPQQTLNNSNDQQEQDGLISYISHQDVSTEDCLVQLNSLPSINNISYVNIKGETSDFDQGPMSDERGQYIPEEAQVRHGAIHPQTSNLPSVPIQVVRPQQLLSGSPRRNSKQTRSLSTSQLSPSSSTPSPPKMLSTTTTTPGRKRATRTLSLGSSSDEGSLMNLSMSSNEAKNDEYTDEDGGKHRRSKQPVPDASKDEKYWRRRQKNNLAAKRSREARKMKETEATEKAAFLEEQNDNLQNLVEELRKRNDQLLLRLSKYENVEDLLSAKLLN